MNFSLQKSIEILECTPDVLITLLQNIDQDWTHQNEGGETWSVYDILGHLIHGEITDWMPRAEIILSNQTNKTFEPFDRFAQLNNETVKSITQLLEEFKLLRYQNLNLLRSKNIVEDQLQLKGIHPVFGEVTLAQLLSTWTVHDLNHLGQIARVMAKQYSKDVGPWIEYLGILKPK